MFLHHIEFIKLRVASSASRYINYFKNSLTIQKKAKQLSLKKKSLAGRSSKGNIIFWTRGSLLKKIKTIKINYNIRNIRLNFIASFQFLPFKNKLVSLIFFSNGGVTYHITTDEHVLFSYTYLNKKKNLRKFFKKPYWSFIFFLKKLIFISFVESVPGQGAQYSLSSGTKARLMVIDKISHTALIILPSKLKRTISYYSTVFLGKIALERHKKYKNTKAGFWRCKGSKPLVRGVAMNPVDHPHGGRTKAIRYQRTPWGKTTKFK